MTEVAKAYVTLIPSLRGAQRTIQNELDGPSRKAGSSAGKQFGSSFNLGVGKILKAGVAFEVGRRTLNFLGDSISAASDLNETTSKSSVIFGRSAQSIARWASTADKALGLSEQAATEAAASFGDMFLQIGVVPKQATKMSKGVVQLAADLGSFNNLSTEDVLERIAGGFRGEYDALQKVIPNISAARVQQEALNKTHKDSVSDLTAAEKAEATLAIIRKDGARAAGDFARTSSGLANSQKIQAAEAQNLQAKIGKGLLPIQLAYTRFMADKAIPAISHFVEGMQDGTGAGGDFADILGDLKDIGEGVLDFFDAIPGPVKKFGAEILIGSIAIGKLNNAMAASRLVAFARDLGTAETRAVRTSKALQGLGTIGRNVAGAGGLALVADSAGKTSEKMGALEGAAGGALAGGALGAFAGPIGIGVGAAIGGLAGATFGLLSNVKEAKKEAKISIPSWKEYRDTLEGVSAATTQATRALAFHRLEESGLLKTTRELGLSDRVAVNAILGTKAAREKLTSALRDNATITNNEREALIKETGALGTSRLATLKRNIAIAKTREEVDAARAALRKFMAQPANKHLTITGVENARQSLNDLLSVLRVVSGIDPVIKVNVSTNVLDPTGIIPPQRHVKRRAIGGQTPAGTYLVGERGPELFTTSQRGHVTSTNELGQGASGSRRVTLQVGEREFTAYMTEVADSRVDAASAWNGMEERAFA